MDMARDRVTNEYANLPLAEVVARVVPHREVGMGLPFFERFRDRFGDTMGSPNDLGRPEPVPGPSELRLELGAPMLGFRFEDTTTGLHVVVQRDLFLVRWLSGDGEYPRYLALREVIARCIAAAVEAEGSDIRCRIANMVYVNRLQVDTGDFGRVEEFLSEVITPDHESMRGRIQTFVVGWRREDGVDCRFELQREEDGSYFLYTAGGVLDPNSETFDSLDRVHDALNSLFPTLLSDKANKLFRWHK